MLRSSQNRSPFLRYPSTPLQEWQLPSPLHVSQSSCFQLDSMLWRPQNPPISKARQIQPFKCSVSPHDRTTPELHTADMRKLCIVPCLRPFYSCVFSFLPSAHVGALDECSNRGGNSTPLLQVCHPSQAPLGSAFKPIPCFNVVACEPLWRYVWVIGLCVRSALMPLKEQLRHK